jgi:hypothetical protein
MYFIANIHNPLQVKNVNFDANQPFRLSQNVQSNSNSINPALNPRQQPHHIVRLNRRPKPKPQSGNPLCSAPPAIKAFSALVYLKSFS